MKVASAISRFFGSAGPIVQVETIRHATGGAAIVFLHGFTATGNAWGQFPSLITQDKRLDEWSILSVCYSSTKSPDVPFWNADPDLNLLAKNLVTLFESEPLSRFRSVALLAHSMGGLIAQKAALHPSVAKRLDHLLLFGTPSQGLGKAIFLSPFKRQARDMTPKSKFIQSVRNEWQAQFKPTKPFRLSVFHGANDVFVSEESNFGPFSSSETKVINGDHLTMILPTSRADTGFIIVVDALLGSGLMRDAVDSAVAAVERGEFRDLVERLYPPKGQLESSVAVNLALALDALGRREDAIMLLETTTDSTTDAIGTLGGRYKRRWLTSGSLEDWTRATALYEKAYVLSTAEHNAEQCMYHSINLAFLHALKSPKSGAITHKCRRYASEALAFADECAQSHWSLATKGEAILILGDLNEASKYYRLARRLAASPRDVGSMYAQALHLANHFFDTRGRLSILESFEIDP